MNVRFAHTADWHLGKKQRNCEKRYWDNFKAAHAIIQSIIQIHKKAPYDFILHSGDLFNEPKPRPEAINLTMDLLKELKENNLNLYIIRGNHDAVQGKLENISLHILERAGLLKVLENESIMFTKENIDICLYGIGHRYHGYKRTISDLLAKYPLDSKKVNILMMHASVEELLNPSKKPLETQFSAKELSDLYFDYIALGHYHIKEIYETKTGYMAYPGASEHFYRSNWEEDGKWSRKKFWLDVTIDNTKNVKILEKEFTVRPKKRISLDLTELDVNEAINKVITLLKESNIETGNEKGIIDFSFSLGFNQIEEGDPFNNWKDLVPNLLIEACNLEFRDKIYSDLIKMKLTDNEIISEIVENLYPKDAIKWTNNIHSSLDIIAKTKEKEEQFVAFRQLLLEEEKEDA